MDCALIVWKVVFFLYRAGSLQQTQGHAPEPKGALIFEYLPIPRYNYHKFLLLPPLAHQRLHSATIKEAEKLISSPGGGLLQSMQSKEGLYSSLKKHRTDRYQMPGILASLMT